MAKEATNYMCDSIPEDWKGELWADLEEADGYKKYFTVDGHDDPYCTQEEFEFWALEKEKPSKYFLRKAIGLQKIIFLYFLKNFYLSLKKN